MSVLLAACNAAPEAASSPPAAAVGTIECATGGGALTAACTVERGADREGTVLTLRHPDGGFRRLRVIGDGHGVIAADGAEAANVTIVARDRIEVAIGDARYRLPATIGSVAR